MPPTLITFDCYGTLIDWHGGLERALREWAGSAAEAARLAERYVLLEMEVESGPYAAYREVMARALEKVLEEAGLPSPGRRRGALAEALPGWEPFPEVPEILSALHRRFPLAILSNIDDDLLDASVRRLGVPFAHRITAERVRSYKPAPAHFRRILELTGREPAEILHVAGSLRHDIAPARELGIPHLWVNRRSEARPGWLPEERVLPDLRLLPRLLGIV